MKIILELDTIMFSLLISDPMMFLGTLSVLMIYGVKRIRFVKPMK